MHPAASNERRRSIRLIPKDLKGSLKIGNQSYPLSTVIDLSTVGIGIRLESPPKETNAHLSFESPKSLKGLEIDAQQRRLNQQPDEAGKTSYQIGYEFMFLSSGQQQQLDRWAAEYLQTQSVEEAEPKVLKILHPFLPKPGPQPNQRWLVRMPKDTNDYERCLDLIPELHLHHALIQTKYFLALEKNNLGSIMVFIPDLIDFKLPADEHIGSYLSTLRSQGHQLAQITTPYFSKDKQARNVTLHHMAKLQMLFSTLPYVITYATHFARITDLVVITIPQLEEFFRMWLFEKVPVPAESSGVSGAVQTHALIPMALNIDRFHEIVPEKRPDLSSLIRNAERFVEQEKNFKNSYFPDHEILKKWFFEKNRVLVNLSSAQEEYFRFLAPHLRD